MKRISKNKQNSNRCIGSSNVPEADVKNLRSRFTKDEWEAIIEDDSRMSVGITECKVLRRHMSKQIQCPHCAARGYRWLYQYKKCNREVDGMEESCIDVDSDSEDETILDENETDIKKALEYKMDRKVQNASTITVKMTRKELKDVRKFLTSASAIDEVEK